MRKTVRVTLELDERFVRLLNANVRLGLLDKVKDGKEIDAGEIVKLVVWSEALGHDDASQLTLILTDKMWRDIGPVPVTEERRVWEDGIQISGPVL